MVYHTKQFSALTSIRGCGLSLFSCLLLEDSIIIRIVFFEDCFCKPCGLLKSQSYRAWVVDNKKERKGGIGTRLWGNWGSILYHICFIPFVLSLKERKSGKTYWVAVTFYCYYKPILLSFFLSVSVVM